MRLLPGVLGLGRGVHPDVRPWGLWDRPGKLYVGGDGQRVGSVAAGGAVLVLHDRGDVALVLVGGSGVGWASRDAFRAVP